MEKLLKIIRMKFNFYMILSFIFLISPLYGQLKSKMQLTSLDYELLGTLRPVAFSDNGRWAAYVMSYETTDTLFVKQVTSGKVYTFPNNASGIFGRDSIFLHINKNQNLIINELTSGKVESINNVSRFDFESNCLIYLEKLERANRLVIKKGTEVALIEGVVDYSLNPAKDMLWYIKEVEGQYSSGIVDLDKHMKQIIIDRPSSQPLKKGAWQSNGKSIGFWRGANDDLPISICLYNILASKLFTFSNRTSSEFPIELEIDDVGLEMKVSDDGLRVFFGVKSTEKLSSLPSSDIVEVWNGSDAQLYPTKEAIRNWSGRPKLAVWHIETSKFRQLSNAEFPWIMLTGDQKYAVVATPGKYGPQHTLYSDMDYYLMDLITGDRKLLFERQNSQNSLMGISPSGRYINYFSASNWWVYDIGKETHTNITKSLNQIWDNTDLDTGNQKGPNGSPCWSADGESILLYDAFDIWKVSADGKVASRLTNGREFNIRYHFDFTNFDLSQYSNYSGLGKVVCDFSGPIILISTDLSSSAKNYFYYTNKSRLKAITSGNFRNSRIIKAKKSDNLIFIQETANQSPKLLHTHRGSTNLIFESNMFLEKFAWTKPEMLQYRTTKNELLNAALFYPANYDVGKQYPMVVFVYEKASRNIHNFVNPSTHNEDGFNISNFTLQDYFVLMPDILYQNGDPGYAALNCVTSAVKHILATKPVDSKKVGLYGHSFGGYETNFIITQTNLFAAAVSGAGITDLVAGYFSYGKNTGLDEMWRYEEQQMRMGKPFYGNEESYYRNSPILFAPNITTPLLLWTGKDDPVVNWSQSMEYFLALRRLKKENVLLVYPRSPHSLIDSNQQLDLTQRVEDWFSFFLKGNLSKKWIFDSMTGYKQ